MNSGNSEKKNPDLPFGVKCFLSILAAKVVLCLCLLWTNPKRLEYSVLFVEFSFGVALAFLGLGFLVFFLVFFKSFLADCLNCLEHKKRDDSLKKISIFGVGVLITAILFKAVWHLMLSYQSSDVSVAHIISLAVGLPFGMFYASAVFQFLKIFEEEE